MDKFYQAICIFSNGVSGSGKGWFRTENTEEIPNKSPIINYVQDDIIRLIKLNPQISREEKGVELNRSEDSVLYYLKKLTKKYY